MTAEPTSTGGLGPSERRLLLEEARGLARERVLAVLVDELAEVMLAQMREELTPARSAQSPAARRPRPAEQDDEALGCYVYGVVSADEAGPPEGVRGIDPSHLTTTVEAEGLFAVVSLVPLADFDEKPLRERLTDMGWLERTARTHEEVLEVIGRERTLIPMRLCSIYRDQEGVEEMLRREADALQTGLDHLRGRTEWGVKVFADRTAMAPGASPLAESVADDQTAEGTAYLHRRRDEHRQLERADQELEDACQEIHSGLGAFAADARVLPVQRPEVTGYEGEMILNAAYLVSDQEHEEFVAELDRLREGFEALELILTGPWPAYNFVPGPIGAGW